MAKKSNDPNIDWDTRQDGTLIFDVMTSWGLMAPTGEDIYLRISYATSQEHLDAVRAGTQKPKRVQVVLSPRVASDMAVGLVKFADGVEARTRVKTKPN